MSGHVSIERMNEAIDGALSAREVSELEKHLTACAACRNEHARLAEAVQGVRSLPRAADPPHAVWNAIAARIDGAQQASVSEPKVLRLPTAAQETGAERADDVGRRRFLLSVHQLAAAAILVALVSAATMWVALGDTPVATATRDQGVPGGAAARAVSLDDGRYAEAVDELEQVLEEGRAVLAPETLAMIEESLRTVEAAIAEVEIALAEDPNSDLLMRMLSSQQSTKLSVLQRAAAAVQAQA